MSSAPNHTVDETGLSNTTVPAVTLCGHAQQLFSHVKIENLIAGLSGGVVSTLVLHPLDLVKIRFAGTVGGYTCTLYVNNILNKSCSLKMNDMLYMAAVSMTVVTAINVLWCLENVYFW